MLARNLPKCWATSKMSFGDLPSTSKALRIGGRLSSNWTSTTAPMTETTRPLLPALAWVAAKRPAQREEDALGSREMHDQEAQYATEEARLLTVVHEIWCRCGIFRQVGVEYLWRSRQTYSTECTAFQGFHLKSLYWFAYINIYPRKLKKSRAKNYLNSNSELK